MSEDFDDALREAPEFVFSAPGRVNLIGEHTDYNGGAALPFAIGRRTTLRLNRRTDRVVRVRSVFEDDLVVSDVDSVLGDGPLEGWSAYLLGVIRVFGSVADLSAASGFDAVVDSDIPVGVGVSSSHALECATAVALDAIWDLGIPRADLIDLTQRVEHEVVGSPTGTLDQSAILLAQADHAVRLEFGPSAAAPALVPLGFDAAGLEVLVIDSTERHHHATGGYKVRRAECEQAAQRLGVGLLGDLTAADLPRAEAELPPELFRRTRHIVTETARVHRLVELMEAGRVGQIGSLLTDSHLSQRDDYECSTPAIDTAVDAAVRAGALGARLTGGGFGGACIALVRHDDAAAVSAAVTTAVVAAGHPEPIIFPVTADDGARRDA